MPRRPTGQEYFDGYMPEPDPMDMHRNSLQDDDDMMLINLMALASLMGTGGIGFGIGASKDKKDEQ